MLENREPVCAGSNRVNRGEDARAFCAAVPGAVSLWSRDRSFCVLSETAKHLINYSEADLVNRPSLWVERIHPDDRQKFCRSLENLGKDSSLMRCDYRFFPRNASGPLWLREHALLGPDQKANAWEIISLYTSMSDLSGINGAETKKEDLEKIALLVHDFSNCFQKVTMELDLAQINLQKRFNFTELVSAMDSINHCLRQLRDLVAGLLERHSAHDPFR